MTGVVVTGMGCVSGLGPDVVSTWRELVAGKTAIQHVKRTVEGHPDFCFEGAVAPICGDALRKLETHFGVRALAGVDVSANYAAAATLEALGDAGLLARQDILQCAAIIYGCATGGQSAIEAGYVRMFLDEETNVHPLSIPRFMLNAAVSHISMLFGARGHSVVVSSACSSSAHAIGEAVYFIRSGRGPVVIAGGGDASLNFGQLISWRSLQALAPDMCRPFSAGRSGTVLGEGAAILILEDEDHARKRGAKIYSHITGVGSNADGFHLTRYDPAQAAAAIRAAHEDAGLAPKRPLLISTHGTGTVHNDKTEAIALKLAYPDNLFEHRAIATKASHGHMLGGTGAMELLTAILTLTHKVAPPILGFLGPDPECDLPLVLKPEPVDYDTAVSASYAFGGLNCVLIAERHAEKKWI